jgi:hypothetical protein
VPGHHQPPSGQRRKDHPGNRYHKKPPSACQHSHCVYQVQCTRAPNSQGNLAAHLQCLLAV